MPRRANGAPPLHPTNSMELSVQSVMAGFEPLRLRVPLEATVGNMKRALKARTGLRKFMLTFNGTELQ